MCLWFGLGFWTSVWLVYETQAQEEQQKHLNEVIAAAAYVGTGPFAGQGLQQKMRYV